MGLSLSDADGRPASVMVVADGHGGQRYWLSHVGSRLACQVALELTAADLRRRHLADPLDRAGEAELLQWLGHDLPGRILRSWREAVSADWSQQERARQGPDGSSFTAATYGSTLGLVVMTPRWWAHTGLGDWDLVLLEGHDRATLVSQEDPADGPGEATQSLCLPEAERCFAGRTGLHRLPAAAEQPLALVLSTDGLRKSCATDADHLALAHFLAGECRRAGPNPDNSDPLDPSLDRISSEGSGDDVSIAVACWGEPSSLALPSLAGVEPSSHRPAQQAGRARERTDEIPKGMAAAATAVTAPSAPQGHRPWARGRTGLAVAAGAGLLALAWLVSGRGPDLMQHLPWATSTPTPPRPPAGPASVRQAGSPAAAAAIASVEQLYRDLSTHRFAAAAAHHDPRLKADFSPGRFKPYSAVSISALRAIGQEGRSVNLEGIVSLIQANGEQVVERRSFVVDTSSIPARVIRTKILVNGPTAPAATGAPTAAPTAGPTAAPPSRPPAAPAASPTGRRRTAG